MCLRFSSDLFALDTKVKTLLLRKYVVRAKMKETVIHLLQECLLMSKNSPVNSIKDKTVH